VAFTYGPLGFLQFPDGTYIEVHTWLMAVAVLLTVHLGFIAATVAFLVTFRAPLWVWIGLLAMTFLPLPGWSWTRPEVEMLLLTVMVLVLALTRPDDRVQLALGLAGGALAAVAVLGKGTSLISTLSILGAFALGAWLRGSRRALVVTAGSALVCSALLWLSAGQSPASLPAYLRSIFEATGGYSAAMSNLADQPTAISPNLMRGCGIAIVLLGVAGVATASWRRQVSLLTLSAMALPVTALAFKEGFIRWHMDYFALVAILLDSLLLVAALRVCSRDRLRVRALMIAPAAFSLALVLPIWWATFLTPALAPVLPIDSLGARFATYPAAIKMLSDPGSRRQVDDEVRAGIKHTSPLPAEWVKTIGTESIDVFPSEVDIPFGYGLRWQPRPALQSYGAYTQYLDQLDAASLQSSRAPAFALVAQSSIDARYPLYDEPVTQRVLMDRYRAVASNGDWVLLRRSTGVCHCPALELGRRVARLGEKVPVPQFAGSRVFVRVQVDYNVEGRLADLFLDPGAVRMRLWTRGVTERFRLVPATARGGLLVSAVANGTEDLARIYSGCPTSPIDAIAVAPDTVALYQPEVTYEFFAETSSPCQQPAP
jgi:hypothetical protein